MKTKVKAVFKNVSLKHNVKSVEIDEESRQLKLTLTNMGVLLKKLVMVKDRKSGRRLLSEIVEGTTTFSLDHLSDLTSDGKLDFYLIGKIGKRRIHRRIGFNSNLKQIHFIDDNSKTEFKVVKTTKNNLTTNVLKTSFKQDTKEIKGIGKNFYIAGTIEDLNNQKPVQAELIFKRRDNNKFIGFNLELKEHSPGIYDYSGLIYLDRFKEHMVVNSRWDALIQLRNITRDVIFRRPLNLQSYSSFDREEDRYLVNVNNTEEYLTAAYATMGLNSLALWYTDTAQFARTYNIAKGKTIFNQVSESQPLNSKMVFFESFFGKNYSGNPKYVYEAMLKNPAYKDFTFVWSYTGQEASVIPGSPIIVDRQSGEYYEYLAKAKYWVSNIVFPVHHKREGNVYLQTWHGTPLKKLGYDIEIEGPETLARENFYTESRNWDYLISANPYSSEIFKRAFKFEKEVLEYGYPANDVFHSDDKKNVELKAKLGIPADKKVILYAPTWRDDEMVGSWNHSFELKFDLEDFYQNFKDEYVLILRMHHLVSDSLEIDDKYQSFVYDCSKYDDIQELYLEADLLITDYSSVFFDYANSKKPILFYAYDFEKYKDEIRGFYLDMEKDLPGPILKDSEELVKAVRSIDSIKRDYATKYDQFYEKFCGLEDGKAADKVVEKVFK
ncbi:CDP-glycerol glycerophosphotransferase family protein [Rossellomorea sp. RS05]|uniref:CDP-glycerol glycerophosphotransferase family protein n=1 Tax=Rossellomorea sp. RS05 TaxID=3149166 RepID=UPI003221B2B5